MSGRQLRSLVLAALLGSLLASSGTAAVFERDWLALGDGLLTYDDVNQREWLDLTETQIEQFPGDSLYEQIDSIVAETQPGGLFEGFVLATDSDVRELSESGGIDTSTLEFGTNSAASVLFIGLLGDTTDPSLNTSNQHSRGFVSSIQPELISVRITHSVSGRNPEQFAGYSPFQYTPSNPERGAHDAVWLYRQVPEPSSALVVCTLLPFLFASRSKR